MKKSYTAGLFNDLSRFIYGKSSFEYAVAEAKKKKTQYLSCLIIHSDPHLQWAEQLENELTQTFPSLIDGISLSCKKLLINGDFCDVTDQVGQELDLSNTAPVQPYSFIITVGEWESQIIHRVREFADITIPQLHCMPSIPVSSGAPLVSLRNKYTITGVYSHPTSPQEYIWALTGIVPQLKTVCIVFDDNDDGTDDDFFLKNRQRNELRSVFRDAGIKVLSHYWSLQQPRLIELEMEARCADAILLPNSPTTHANMAEIRRIGARNKIMLCSAELDSVISGASIGAGIIGAGFAAPLMSLMVDIVLANEIASAEPIKIPQQSGLRYNLAALEEQGVKVSEQLRALLRMKSVFDKDITEY